MARRTHTRYWLRDLKMLRPAFSVTERSFKISSKGLLYIVNANMINEVIVGHLGFGLLVLGHVRGLVAGKISMLMSDPNSLGVIGGYLYL